jgi:hypothetical protein
MSALFFAVCDDGETTEARLISDRSPKSFLTCDRHPPHQNLPNLLDFRARLAEEQTNY